MAILKFHRLKSEHIMGLGRNLRKEADVRHRLYNDLNRLLTWCNLAQVTIDMLHDVALLEIFEFYVYGNWTEAWYTLVHVCRKWRNIVLGSPRRLDLQLFCRART